MDSRAHRRFYLALAVAGVVFGVAVAAIVVALWARHDSERRDERAREESRLVICQQIEQLRTQRRLDAWRSWNTLPTSLRLLGVKRTPELIRVARRQRDRTLREFAPVDCAVFAKDNRVVYVAANPAERKTGLRLGG